MYIYIPKHHNKCNLMNWFGLWCLTLLSTIFQLYHWIYNYPCNQCLSPLMLWVWISIRVRCTTLCDRVCQWLTTGQWFSLCPPGSSTDRHNITEILLKLALNTIKPTNQFVFYVLPPQNIHCSLKKIRRVN
jgi:hypothetical protein